LLVSACGENRRKGTLADIQYLGEKRKQKLALLDQILNIEDADLPPDSPSEVNAISQNGLSVAVSSRETSQSPVPATLASSSITTAPPSISWLSTASSPALVGTDIGFPRNSAAEDPGYTFDGSDMWCTGYDYHDTSNIDNSLDAHPSTFQGTDHQDFMTATTAYPNQAPYNNTTEYATPPAALQHLHHHHHHHLIPSLNAPPQPGSLGTGEMYHDDNTTSTWLSSTSSSSSKDATSTSSSQPVAAALTAFSHLSPAQQDQMLDMIYRQRGGMLGTSSLNTGVDCPATPPSGE
jgi:hypothetical protein